jgi:hypothetical protein
LVAALMMFVMPVASTMLVSCPAVAQSVASIEGPFARDALCSQIKFCPEISNAKAWQKIIYDLAVGALVSLLFYVLVVRVPDYQKRPHQPIRRNITAPEINQWIEEDE